MNAGFPESEFGRIITKDFADADANCPTLINEGFTDLMSIKSRTQADWDEVSKIFMTCDPISSANDIDSLYNHLMNGFSYMAMTDYPY